MNTPKLTWYSVKRDEIPKIAFGASVPQSRQQDSQPLESKNDEFIANVGFSWEKSEFLDYHSPAIFVLHDESVAETLSWLRVYARDSFPLSQFGRVISHEDWGLLFNKGSFGGYYRDDLWASVILGEILAQSDQEVPLDLLPLSRAQACFSTAIARTKKLHESPDLMRMCTDRLRTIELDSRFNRRSVSVEALIPVWSMASASFGNIKDINELANLLYMAAASYDNENKYISSSELMPLPPNLFSDSIEDRVVAFQKLGTEVSSFTGTFGAGSAYAAALIAVGAFLVGRGTSHSFLLKKFPKIAPRSYIWFGLMAGIAGFAYWDSMWAKGLKGVEKHLRSSFSWNDSPMADISWAEYNWLKNVIRGSQAFSGISKQVQTSISIEILPGASCQMRLSVDRDKQQVDEHAANNSKASQSTKNYSVHEVRNVIPLDLISTLTQLLNISDKVKDILSKNSPDGAGQVATDRRGQLDKSDNNDLFKINESVKAKKSARRIPKGKQ